MRQKPIIGIYKITNTNNGKVYVGQSNDVIDRFRHHKSELNHQRHKNVILQNSWNLHGEKAFKFEIIEECSEDKLDEREIYWIDKLNAYVHCKTPNGYNLTTGGEGTRTIHPVLQFDLMGNFITEWQNGIIASQQTGINVGTIYGCCVKRLKRADKYIFVYKDDYEKDKDLSWYLGSRKMKPIGQFDLYGNLINVWNGTEEIHRTLGYVPHQCLSHASMSYNGFIFRYMDDLNDITEEYCNRARSNKESLEKKNFYQVDKNRNIVKEYHSIREAVKDGYSLGMISKCLRKTKKIYKGYFWIYVNEFDSFSQEDINNILDYESNKSKKVFYSVRQYDLNHNFIKEYPYLSSVREDGFMPTNVRDVCQKYKPQYKGYLWEYGEIKENPFNNPVVQYDKNNNYIAEYPSLRIASDQTGISETCIGGVCNNRHKTTHGHIFKYKNNMIE